MRRHLVLVAAAALLAGQAMAHEPIAQARRIAFPKLPDGRSVLAVDLHTHSVFSDGSVWPDIRVQEAKRDGLYALAVSEHLEYQPKAQDIPHADRNRSFQVASQAAVVRSDATGPDAQPLMVINGSEITKFTLAAGGHINAVFLSDANALKGTDPRQQLEAAKQQGAFVFWNHPYWHSQAPDGLAKLDPLHADLIKAGLIHGVEVANGADMSDEAFQIALDNKLTILGTSDIHGLIDWDYDLENGGHRTATLVLTRNETQDGLKAALKAGDTVAIYNDNLVGLKANVEAVVRATLKLDVGQALPRTTVVGATLINDSPVDYTLENIGNGFYDEARVFTVKAGSRFTLFVPNTPNAANLSLNLRVLNAYTAPKQHLEVVLRDS